MAKKKNNNNGNEGSMTGEEKNASSGGGGGGKKKAEPPKEPIEVVLKMEIHCDGCASKLTKLSRSFSGVESAKADMGSGKLTVVGRVDPTQLREFLAQKTKKKVDVVSPQPKKEDNNKNKEKEKEKENNNEKEKENKKKDDKKPPNDSNNKKPKEAQVTTAVIKMSLHCQGCIEKIHKIVSKTKGVQEVSIDKQKELVAVKGTMDVKALTETLKVRFKRNVEVVPPAKKDKEEGDNAGGNGGKKKKGGGGGEEKEKEKENGGGVGGGGAGMMMVGENRMDYMMQPGVAPGYGFVGQPVYAPGFVGQPVFANGTMGQPVYANGYMGQPVYGYGPDNGYGYQVPGYPAHMKFNDENPNACSVM